MFAFAGAFTELKLSVSFSFRQHRVIRLLQSGVSFTFSSCSCQVPHRLGCKFSANHLMFCSMGLNGHRLRLHRLLATWVQVHRNYGIPLTFIQDIKEIEVSFSVLLGPVGIPDSSVAISCCDREEVVARSVQTRLFCLDGGDMMGAIPRTVVSGAG